MRLVAAQFLLLAICGACWILLSLDRFRQLSGGSRWHVLRVLTRTVGLWFLFAVARLLALWGLFPLLPNLPSLAVGLVALGFSFAPELIAIGIQQHRLLNDLDAGGSWRRFEPNIYQPKTDARLRVRRVLARIVAAGTVAFGVVLAVLAFFHEPHSERFSDEDLMIPAWSGLLASGAVFLVLQLYHHFFGYKRESALSDPAFDAGHAPTLPIADPRRRREQNDQKEARDSHFNP